MEETLSIEYLSGANTWIDQLPDGLLVCATDGTIVVANEKLAQISGYAREELTGMSVDELVPLGQRDAHPRQRDAFVAENRTRAMGHPGADLHLARKDGESVPVEISLAPFDGRRTRGVIAVVRDVTERRKVETALRTSNELLSLAHERERIARDLHDTVLQRLFGLGLELQAVSLRAPADLAPRLEGFVDEIDTIIKEIRTAVFTLGSATREGSLGAELSTVIAQAKRVLGFTPRLRLDGAVETATTPEIRTELLASLREALGNVGRHAAATETEIELDAAADTLTLRVLDNGRGVPEGFRAEAGNGLRNMRDRAGKLGGSCELLPRAERAGATPTTRGSELVWRVPLPR